MGPGKGLFNNKREYAGSVLIMLAGVALSLILFLYLIYIGKLRENKDFEGIAVERVHAVQERILLNNGRLEAVRTFFSASREVERREFHEFVKPFLKADRGIQAFEWIPRVAGHERRKYEHDARRDGITGFTITEKGPAGKMVPARVKSEYYPVYFLEPYKGNEPVLGFDLASEETRRKTMEQARDTGEAVATDLIQLIQDHDEQYGMLIFLPIYAKGSETDTIEARRNKLQGFVLGVFSINDVVTSSLAHWKKEEKLVYLHIYDITSPAGNTLIYSSAPPPLEIKRNEFEAGIYYKAAMDVKGRKWLFLCAPSPHYLTREEKLYPHGFLIAGLALTTMAAFLTFHAARRRREAGLYTENLEASRAALLESESEFRRLSQEFQGLLDAIPDCLIFLDRNMKVLWANRAAAETIGTTPEAAIGRNCYALWYDRATLCEPCPVGESFSTGQPLSEIVARPDGRIWDLRAIPLTDQQGYITGVIELKRDITEHRKLEAQYIHAQKMESIGTLAGGVAHDFNNILSAIIGYGHIALMKIAQNDPLRRNIESMLEGADRAAVLTKELLLFSRKQISELKPVDLNKVVGQVEKFLKRVIGEDVVCTKTLTDHLLTVFADSHQLEQVLMNLATNARDAMPGGGVFNVLTEEVSLHEDFIATHGYGKSGPYALITVSDTGRGMDEETRKHIFEPFFTTKEVGKGTGLGLAVVYGIVKQHEGFINVYSEPGKGTTFRIYLPITASAVVEETLDLQEAVPARGTETVLLAEDDAALRKLSMAILADYGYTVIEAVDGEDAVRKFIENKDAIQLLLFDLIMPKMNGKEAYDEIRKIRPDMKVLFASGYAPNLVRQKTALEEGAHLIYKPMSPVALLRKVRSVLEGTEK